MPITTPTQFGPAEIGGVCVWFTDYIAGEQGMKIKTSELTGAVLDWAVAKCEYDDLAALNIQYPEHAKHYPKVSPSTDWAQGGPIIERELLELGFDGAEWYANKYDRTNPGGETYLCGGEGPTPLIAATRCYIAIKLGDEVEIPDELTR